MTDSLDHTDQLHDHDRGLSHDLPTLLSRRRMLTRLGGGAGIAALAACGTAATSATSASTSASTSSAAGSTAAASRASAGEMIPEETGGPYPADGSNGVNVLTESGIVRSDITTSFGTASGVAAGVPLTINLLRGVQETDGDGNVTFTSIYPAAYSGRWPHIHFEVYPSLTDATAASSKLRTSQLALPEDTSTLVCATDGYSQSVRNMAQSSLESDNVFSDGYSLQLATVTGDVDTGLVAALNVPV